jgi:hypothetical protein
VRERLHDRGIAGSTSKLAGLRDQHTEASKPVRSGSPRLGRFDSCAAPLEEAPHLGG